MWFFFQALSPIELRGYRRRERIDACTVTQLDSQTFHRVSRERLRRYLADFDFRCTTSRLSDGEWIAMLVRRIGEGG